MLFIALSVLCSVCVSIVLKLAQRLQLDMRLAIAVNYVVAAVLAGCLLHPGMPHPQRFGVTGMLLLAGLGLGLPAMFWVLARAVATAGVVRTDAAMRLSLLLPLLAAFVLFGQALTPVRGLGVLLGLAAVACLVLRRDPGSASTAARAPLLLLVVFAGMGLIDILFKLMARLGRVSADAVLLTAFVLAAVVSLLVVLRQVHRHQARWRGRHVAAGMVLGALNFGNIVFYIQAHRALPANPALVFAAMNIGVIALATLVGVALFGERLSRINLAGLGLAVIAVLVLAGR